MWKLRRRFKKDKILDGEIKSVDKITTFEEKRNYIYYNFWLGDLNYKYVKKWSDDEVEEHWVNFIEMDKGLLD